MILSILTIYNTCFGSLWELLWVPLTSFYQSPIICGIISLSVLTFSVISGGITYFEADLDLNLDLDLLAMTLDKLLNFSEYSFNIRKMGKIISYFMRLSEMMSKFRFWAISNVSKWVSEWKQAEYELKYHSIVWAR